MKFTLVYDGQLHSQNTDRVFEKKWDIRAYLNPQLANLWRTHPGLTQLARYVPRGGYSWAEMHHLDDGPMSQVQAPPRQPTDIDLQAPVDVSGIQFMPLVRDSYALRCSLKILFMRKEPAGRVYQGGDLDNRIKLFIDALKIPKSEADRVAQIYPAPTEPINCLLEDDGLISALSVESTRLLDAPNTPENYVRLIVEVTVAVTQARFYNYSFLGD
jgi:hypothetical protein